MFLRTIFLHSEQRQILNLSVSVYSLVILGCEITVSEHDKTVLETKSLSFTPSEFKKKIPVVASAASQLPESRIFR